MIITKNEIKDKISKTLMGKPWSEKRRLAQKNKKKTINYGINERNLD